MIDLIECMSQSFTKFTCNENCDHRPKQFAHQNHTKYRIRLIFVLEFEEKSINFRILFNWMKNTSFWRENHSTNSICNISIDEHTAPDPQPSKMVHKISDSPEKLPANLQKKKKYYTVLGLESHFAENSTRKLLNCIAFEWIWISRTNFVAIRGRFFLNLAHLLSNSKSSTISSANKISSKHTPMAKTAILITVNAAAKMII